MESPDIAGASKPGKCFQPGLGRQDLPVAVITWLAFYHRYQTDLVGSRFSIFGQLNVPNHKIEAQNRTFAYIRNLDFQELPTNTKTIFLVNATDGTDVSGRIRGSATVRSYLVQVFNRFLEPELNRMRLRPNSNGVLDLSVAVQQGGFMLLTGIESS